MLVKQCDVICSSVYAGGLGDRARVQRSDELSQLGPIQNLLRFSLHFLFLYTRPIYRNH